MIRKVLLTTIGGVLVLFMVAQLVPCRVSNPPILQEPSWDQPQTEALARRACFDCHSNEVKVPWYGRVAPTAWIVRDHVDEGRHALNMSEMSLPQEEAHEAGEEVTEGKMPPRYYTLLHPEARLTDAERRSLAAGLDATLGGEAEQDGHGGHGEHEEDDD